MKQFSLTLITLTSLGFNVNAQDSTAFIAAHYNLSVDGSQKFASIPTPGSNLRLTGDWTIEAWINIHEFSSKNSIVETYSSGNTGGFALRVTNSKEVQAYQLANGVNSYHVVQSSVYFDTNTWYHIAATLNETTEELKIYVNGELEGTLSATIATSNSNEFLKIGSLGDALQANGKTAIDEVIIWNFAKTQAQIQADTISCLEGDETNLLAWYDFENITDSVLLDKSTHGNDGTFENFNPQSFSDGHYSCAEISTNVSEHTKEIPASKIYPNPASNQFRIETNQPIESVTITDVMGKTVKTLIPTNNSVNINDLTNGLYFLQIKTNNGYISHKLFKE